MNTNVKKKKKSTIKHFNVHVYKMRIRKDLIVQLFENRFYSITFILFYQYFNGMCIFLNTLNLEKYMFIVPKPECVNTRIIYIRVCFIRTGHKNNCLVLNCHGDLTDII